MDTVIVHEKFTNRNSIVHILFIFDEVKNLGPVKRMHFIQVDGVMLLTQQFNAFSDFFYTMCIKINRQFGNDIQSHSEAFPFPLLFSGNAV